MLVKRRNWRKLDNKKLTRAEKVMKFCETYCLVPEGELVGKPIRLAEFQENFIYAVYDNPFGTRSATLSIARKNAKTATIAMLLLCHIAGTESIQNSQIISGAMSREQAALVFDLASKMIYMSPQLSARCAVVQSTKKIKNIKNGCQFKAISAEGKTAHGLSPVLAILDETGQVVGASSPFVDAITTSQGAHKSPLIINISTQASSDSDYLSLIIDDARDSQNEHIVCHVYAAEDGCDIMDVKQWSRANPALDLFRSRADLKTNLEQALRIPARQSSAMNLLLNMRITQNTLWISPSVWKENTKPVNKDLFFTKPVHIGLDLSFRTDLTAAVLSTQDDDGVVHLLPLVFVPEHGLFEKSQRDKAPYVQWVKDGYLIACAGKTIDYAWITEYLRNYCQKMLVSSVNFDRWGIELFRQQAISAGFEANYWIPVGQGYKDFSPRLNAFETALLQGRIAHGGHPLLNMSVANAVVLLDPAGNKKLDKSATSQRIDPLVAAVMAAFPLIEKSVADFDIGAFIV